MSHQDEDAAELQPTFAPGYKPGEKKTVDEYATLDANDESLNRWKASLGIGAGATSGATGPKVEVLTLFLSSPTLPPGKSISINVADAAALEAIKENSIQIKEDVEYNVGITFKVNGDVITGLRYIHIVKRAGIKVDKMEQMIGSFGPKPDGSPHTSNFPTEESPSGMIARSGKYSVRSRIVDDDGQVYADFEWTFKLAKEW